MMGLLSATSADVFQRFVTQTENGVFFRRPSTALLETFRLHVASEQTEAPLCRFT